jgi:hypothetical protein
MNKFDNYKLIMIYINESHKTMLEDFFDDIHFHMYTVKGRLKVYGVKN